MQIARYLKKMIETLAHGTHLKVLSKSFPMNTNMKGFRWFSKIFAPLEVVLCTKIASALGGPGLSINGLNPGYKDLDEVLDTNCMYLWDAGY